MHRRPVTMVSEDDFPVEISNSLYVDKASVQEPGSKRTVADAQLKLDQFADDAAQTLNASYGKMKRFLLWLVDLLSGYKPVDKDQERVMNEQASKRAIIKKEAVEWLKDRQARKDVIFSAFVFCMMMILYFVVVVLQRQISSAFSVEYAIKNYIDNIEYTDEGECVGEVLDDVRDFHRLWLWLEQGYLPALFPDPEWYNGDEFTENEQGYFLEYNRLIGGFKMVQQRVDPCQCDDSNDASTSTKVACGCPKRYPNFYPTVWPVLSSKSKSRSSFGPEHDPAKYEYQAEHGGFVAIIPPDGKEAMLTLAELKSDRWIDKETRRITVTFNAYNGNLRMFTVFKLNFDISASGKILSRYRANTFRVECYTNEEDLIRAGLELVFALYVVCQICSEFNEIYGRRLGETQRRLRIREYLFKFTNMVDIFRILLYAAISALWIIFQWHPVVTNLELPLPKTTLFYDLDELADLNELSKRLHAVLIFVFLLTTFKYMNASPIYGIVVRTVIKAGPALIQYFLMVPAWLLCPIMFWSVTAP